MKIVILFFLSIFLFSFYKEDKIIHDFKVENSLLWKIEKEGEKGVSFLFGTMHLIKKDFFYFPKSLEKIVKSCKLVITEIDLRSIIENPDIQSKLILKEGVIWDYFTEEQKNELFKWAKEKLMINEDVFEANFSKLKPFVLLQTVTQFSFNNDFESYEMKISEIVGKNNIKSDGFESIDEQIAIFDGLPISEQVEMLMETIRNYDEQDFELNRLQKNYREQRLDSLSIIMFDNKSIVKKNEQVFLYERNKKWMPKIESNILKKKCFIAVGAGHLLGEEGLINLLKSKGYKLTPIKF